MSLPGNDKHIFRDLVCLCSASFHVNLLCAIPNIILFISHDTHMIITYALLSNNRSCKSNFMSILRSWLVSGRITCSCIY